MSFIRRAALETDLRDGLEAPGPALLLVRGFHGSGKSTLVRTVLGDLGRSAVSRRRIVAVVGTPGPTAGPRRSFADALERAGMSAGAADPLGWLDLFGATLEDLERTRQPLVVALDEVRHLSDPAFASGLARLWSGARARGLPLHLLLCDGHDATLDEFLASGGALDGAMPRTVTVGPLSSATIRTHLPTWSPRDRFLLQACLGPTATALGRVDPALRLSSNVQRLVLDAEGPLHSLPPRLLESRLQKPDRYAGILRALSSGPLEWGGIRAENPEFGSGNQLAPYLATLQDLDWVRAERSLDASPRSRRTRYRLADPLLGFWYRVVEPALGRLLAGEAPASIWRDAVPDAVGRHAATIFPVACRQVLLERGEDVLPGRMREAGGVWGDGVDLPVAGILRNGAVLYGTCVWGRAAGVDDADDVLRQMRATRYGFGREGRLRVLFTASGATEALLRRVARDEYLSLVPIQALF